LSRDGRKTGGGSRKGIPNKVTGDVKAMILAALDKAGGEAYLARQANENPGPFMTLVGKVLPTQVTGKDDAPLIPEQADPNKIALGVMAILAAAKKAEPKD
jgi:hypothetical protein